MLEVFVPENIKDKIFLNNISKKLEDIIMSSFNLKKIKKIQTKNMFGTLFLFEKFDSDFIVLSNWEFGKYYFVDYDFIENNDIEYSWVSIYKNTNIEKELKNIWKNIEEILEVLSSDKLITNTIKQNILNKINDTFFTLSWVLYVLQKNKYLSEENAKILDEYDWNIEYESQAKLLNITTENKRLKLDLNIEKYENMIELYLWSLEKIFLKI